MAGRLTEALSHGRTALTLLEAEPVRKLGYLGVLTDYCLRARNRKCAVEFDSQRFRLLAQLTDSDTRRKELRWEFIDGIGLTARGLLAFGNYQQGKELADVIREFTSALPAAENPWVYSDVRLVAGLWKIRNGELVEAAEHVEAAWATFLSRRVPTDVELLRFLPHVISAFRALGQQRRAVMLGEVAVPLVVNRGRASLYDTYSLLLELQSVKSDANDQIGATAATLYARQLLEEIELPDHELTFQRRLLNVLLLVDCFVQATKSCSESDKAAAELRGFIESPEARQASPSDIRDVVLALALHDLGHGRDLSNPVKAALRAASDLREPAQQAPEETSVSAAAMNKVAAFLDAVSAKNEPAAARAIEVAALTEIARARNRTSLAPFDVAPVSSYPRALYSLATAFLFNLRASRPDVEDLLFELAEVMNQSPQSVEGRFLELFALTETQQEAAALQAAHRLTQDLLLLERRVMSAKVNAWTGKDMPELKPGMDGQLLVRLDARSRELDRFDDVLKKVRQRQAASSPPLRSVQAALRPNERYITHLLLDNKSVTTCVSPKDSWAHVVTVDRSRFFRAVKLTQLALTNPSPPSQAVDSTFTVDEVSYLTEAVLAPQNDCFQGAEHIIFSPSEALRGVPLHVLLDPSAPKTSYSGRSLASMPWFGMRYSISNVSGYQHLLAARRLSSNSARPRAYLGVGDPLLTGQTVDGQARGKSVLRGMADGTGLSLAELGELPDTADELLTSAKSFGDTARVLTRESASEAAVRREMLRDYEVIAFATHGLIREEIEGVREPALVFTPTNSTWPADDGILTATDISRMDIGARVVVLSACNSAKFDIDLFGPEAASLSTAFFLAGARSTVASLWSVNSEATARLMKNFSAALAKGDGPAESLRRAMTQFVGSRDLPQGMTHPRYWASFTTYGDGSTRPMNANGLSYGLTGMPALQAEPGHIQRALPTSAGQVLVNGAVPQQEGKPYAGYIKVVSADGRTVWQRIDTGHHIHLVTAYPDGSAAALAYPNDVASSGAFELRVYASSGDVRFIGHVDRIANEAPLGAFSVDVDHFVLASTVIGSRTLRIRLVDARTGEVSATYQYAEKQLTNPTFQLLLAPDARLRVLVSGKRRLQDAKPALTKRGVIYDCSMRDETRTFSLTQRLEDVTDVSVYQGIRVVAGLLTSTGEQVLLANRHNPCTGELEGAALSTLTHDGVLKTQPIETSGLRASSSKLVETDRGFYIVAHVERTFDSAMVDDSSHQTLATDLHPIRGENLSKQVGFMLIHLDKSLRQLATEVALFGLSTYVEAAVPKGDELLLFGSTGDRQFGTTYRPRSP